MGRISVFSFFFRCVSMLFFANGLQLDTEKPAPRKEIMFAFLNEPVLDLAAVEPVLKMLEENNYFAALLDEHIPGAPTLYTYNHMDSQRNGTFMPYIRGTMEFAYEWLFVGTAHTRINLKELEDYIDILDAENDENKVIIGLGQDIDRPRITQHFFVSKEFKIPLISSGVLFKRSFLDKIFVHNAIDWPKSILVDPQFDFFKRIYDEFKIFVKTDPRFCLFQKNQIDDIPCVSYTVQSHLEEYYTTPEEKLEWEIDRQLVADHLAILVKSFDGNYETRVKTTNKLWLNDINLSKAVTRRDDGEHNIKWYIMSNKDVENDDHVINLNIENTERGHCSKTFEIFKYFQEKLPERYILFLVDDDTLVNVDRLIDMLVALKRYPASINYPSRHNTQAHRGIGFAVLEGEQYSDAENESILKLSPLVLGERYSYGHWESSNRGYDYPTMGAGLIIDRKTINLIMECETCRCNTPTEPDDMALGRWLKKLSIPIRNQYAFHQATPDDYLPLQLQVQLYTNPAITFHRHGKTFEETKRRYEKYLLNNIDSENTIQSDIKEEL